MRVGEFGEARRPGEPPISPTSPTSFTSLTSLDSFISPSPFSPVSHSPAPASTVPTPVPVSLPVSVSVSAPLLLQSSQACLRAAFVNDKLRISGSDFPSQRHAVIEGFLESSPEVPLRVLLDTGATQSFISQDVVDRLSLDTLPYPKPRDLLMFDDTPSTAGPLAKFAEQRVKIAGRAFRATLGVTRLGGSDIVLGLPWMLENNIALDFSAHATSSASSPPEGVIASALATSGSSEPVDTRLEDHER